VSHSYLYKLQGIILGQKIEGLVRNPFARILRTARRFLLERFWLSYYDPQEGIRIVAHLAVEVGIIGRETGGGR
jgi:hypothetical protein